MLNSDISRREMFAVGSAFIMSGCLENSPLSSGEIREIALGSIIVEDDRDDVAMYQIQLQREGKILYQGEVEVDSHYEIIDSTWSVQPAEYKLIWANDDAMGSVLIPHDLQDELDGGGCYHPRVLRRRHRGPVVDVIPNDDIGEGVISRDEVNSGECG